MKINEKDFVSNLSKVSPYLSPIPTAFFVVRATILYLNVPLVIGIIIGLVVELLGLSSIYILLWQIRYNSTKRQKDEQAPVILSVVSVAVYFVTVVLLTTVFELFPDMSKFSTIMFPILSLIGGLNLALISHQTQREQNIYIEKSERKNRVVISSLDIANEAKKQKQDSLFHQIEDELNSGNNSPSVLAKKFGKSRTTIYSYMNRIQNGNNHHELLS